ncbi:hypothetical protein GCM10010307_84460 [Streptomyces vastus]|uniref:Uncharacterized protein n=1 Tax=Streptomyces vastus TaxID=285451 RepID=A0ABN3S1M2_9ACTN
MHYLSQLLAWARVALLGRRTPGRHSRPAAPQEAPQAAPGRLSPAVLGARLVAARRHRTGQPTAPVQAPQAPQVQERAERFPPRPWEATGAMVRPYVAHLGEERQHALSARQFMEVSR